MNIKILVKKIYIWRFFYDIYLRPSCYNCNFKGIERVSDVTVANFWRIENILPKMDDDKGTSLIVVHSWKRQTII